MLFFLALLFVSLARVASSNVAPRLPGSPFPVSYAPSVVYVLNITGATYDARILAQTLSGIVAQRAPEMFLLDAASGPGPGGESLAQWHLNLLPLTTSQKHYEHAHDVGALLKLFRSDLAGYVLTTTPPHAAPDNGPMHVAVGLAGVLKAVVVTQETLPLATAAGLALVKDVRNFTLQDSFQQYESKFSTTLLLNQKSGNLVYTVDWAVMAGAFALYDPELTMPLSQRALSRLSPLAMVLGWASEVDFVTSASQHGHQVLCSDFITNVPLFSNFAPPSLPPTPPPPPFFPLTGRHTVVFMFTDGDSLSWDLGTFPSPAFDWWGSPRRGTVPIAWTFQPALQEIHPYFLDWVRRNATAVDTLIGGPSGAGYTYLDQYPSSSLQWASPEKVSHTF